MVEEPELLPILTEFPISFGSAESLVFPVCFILNYSAGLLRLERDHSSSSKPRKPAAAVSHTETLEEIQPSQTTTARKVSDKQQKKVANFSSYYQVIQLKHLSTIIDEDLNVSMVPQ